MRSKSIKILGMLLVLFLSLELMGNFVFADEKELTPLEWSSLKWQDKLKYKTIVIKDFMWTVPSWMEEKNLPIDVTTLREKIHTGNTDIPYSWYNVALFETAHPKVYLKPASFAYWGAQAVQNLIAMMAAGNAPSVYVISDPAGAIRGGLAADITDLVTNEWQNLHIKEKKQLFDIWEQMCWNKGRCYALPGYVVSQSCLRYRKDWFREAAIFNKKGEPGPPEDWTWQDFREICKKLTNPKKKKFAIGYRTRGSVYATVDLVTLYAVDHGWPITCNDRITPAWIMPDKTGKQVYKAGVIKPIVDALKFFNEMRWQDNSLLVEPNAKAGTQFRAGRTAMAYQEDISSVYKEPITNPHKYSPTETTEDLQRMTSPPTAPYGIQPNSMYYDPVMLDATLDKEELKAAFDWACWNMYGRGFQNELTYYAQLQEAGLKNVGGWPFFMLETTPFKVEVPPIVKEVLNELNARYPATRKNTKQMIEKNSSLPVVPCPRLHGLEVKNSKKIQDAENSLRYAVLIKENASRAEIEKMVKEASIMVNKKFLNYKIENSVEKWRKYFKIVDDFYKKNYPKFYGSKDYEENFVSYFKF